MQYLVKSFRNVKKNSANICSLIVIKRRLYLARIDNNCEIHESPRRKPDLLALMELMKKLPKNDSLVYFAKNWKKAKWFLVF